MPTLQRGKAIYRVREVMSPIMREERGLRIEVTLPNLAGRKPFSDIAIPSFDRPYFVAMFGDYETWDALHKKWPSICKAIFRMGFTSMVEYKPEDYRDLAPPESGSDEGGNKGEGGNNFFTSETDT